MSEEFEDVSARIPMWNPAAIKNEAGQTTLLEATDKSYIVGFYLGSRTIDNPKKPGETYTVHRVHATDVGDHAHDGNAELAEKGSLRELWGSAVIDSMLEENVTPGQKVKITYLGVAESKTGRGYKNYNVGVSTSADPVTVDNLRIVDYTPASKSAPVDNSNSAPKQPTQATAEAATIEEEEDDLPF